MQEEIVLQVQKLLFICYSNLKAQKLIKQFTAINYIDMSSVMHDTKDLFDASCVNCLSVDLLLWGRNVRNLRLSLMSLSMKTSSMIK
jgi:hypothetical protein